MKSLLIIIIFSLSNPVFSFQKILGKFSTVSESQCNSEIHLFKNGKGIFVESCRREDSPDINAVDKHEISWQMNKNKLNIKINGINESFTYHNKLSCIDFGEKGSANGLVGFDFHFWRKPIKCK